MKAEALDLYRFAITCANPPATLARWLVQDFTPHNAALCIFALHQLTGRLWRHPETPDPDLRQKATCPTIWTQAVEIVLRHDPDMDKVVVGDKQSMGGSTNKLERYLQSLDPIHVDRNDLPDSGIVSPAPEDIMRVRYSEEDRAVIKAKSNGPPVRRFVPPKRRGTGAVKRFGTL